MQDELLTKEECKTSPDVDLEEGRRVLAETLKLQIREKLTVSVNNHPEIILRIPCASDVYSGTFGNISKTPEIEDLNRMLGPAWNYRIVNRKYEFAYVKEGTITQHLTRCRPLTDFQLEDNGTLTERQIDRGYVLTFRFVRSYGAESEFKTMFGNK